MAEQVKGRKLGVPEGRTERVERIVRTTYPDGTVADSEPTNVAVSGSVSFAGLASIFSKVNEPRGTSHTVFSRTVTTEATPWVEVGPPTSMVGEDSVRRELADRGETA